MEGLFYKCTSPPVIYEDLILVSGGGGEGPRREGPGHIRGYDVYTGKRRWIFHTIPFPGEFGYETWSPDSWDVNGGTNNWAGMKPRYRARMAVRLDRVAVVRLLGRRPHRRQPVRELRPGAGREDG